LRSVQRFASSKEGDLIIMVTIVEENGETHIVINGSGGTSSKEINVTRPAMNQLQFYRKFHLMKRKATLKRVASQLRLNPEVCTVLGSFP
jgi:hypothetical protein